MNSFVHFGKNDGPPSCVGARGSRENHAPQRARDKRGSRPGGQANFVKSALLVLPTCE